MTVLVYLLVFGFPVLVVAALVAGWVFRSEMLVSAKRPGWMR